MRRRDPESLRGGWSALKIALVYDWVNKLGGAERILLALHEIWPQAPLFTTVYHPKAAPWAADFQIRTSFLQKFPLAKRHHELYFWLTPIAFESFDFAGFDVVVSVTSADAKGILTKPETLHLGYCLTPTRYLWSGYADYFFSPGVRFLASPLVLYLRAWDKIASTRPDAYLAISETVQKRIKKYYQRESTVIYPPVDLEKFRIKEGRDKGKNKRKSKGEETPFFLIVSRLVPYKRVGIAIEAFNHLGYSLKIVGSGIEGRRLRRMARKNIEFLGRLTDEELVGYYQRCQGLIFPTEEDFGLVPLEAQACGCPVIALRKGGALETVVEGKTGEFFSPQTPEALASVVKSFDKTRYNEKDCRKNAARFRKEVFQSRFKDFLVKAWEKHRKAL